MFVLIFDVGEYELDRAAVGEDSVFDRLEFRDVVLMNLRTGPLVAKGSYHLIYSVMQPEDVRVRLEILPVIAVDRQNKLNKMWNKK